MSRLDLKVTPTMPDSFAPISLSTSEPYIAAKSQVEYRPKNDSTIDLANGFGSSNAVEFIINSRDGWADMSESYIELDLQVNVSDGSNDFNTALCTGGVHSAFYAIRVYEESGVLFDQVEEYASWYAAMSMLSHSKNYVETYGASAGDSVYEDIRREAALRPIRLSATSITLGQTAANPPVTTITGTGSKFLQDGVAVGDMLLLVPSTITSSATGSNSAAIVTVLNSTPPTETVLITTPAFSVSTVANTGGVYNVYKLGIPGYLYNSNDKIADSARKIEAASTRALVGKARSTEYVKLRFRPHVGFLKQPMLMLRYLRNLRIVLEFNAPWKIVMANRLCPASTKTYSVKYQNCRYVMSIVQPVEEVIEAWDARYSSDEGIIMNYTSNMRIMQQDSLAATYQMVIPCKVASARGIISMLKPEGWAVRKDALVYSATTGAGSSFTMDSSGIAIGGLVTEYQYTIGTDRFPLRRTVKVDDYGLENLRHNYICLGLQDMTDGSRLDPVDIRKIRPSTDDLLRGKFYGFPGTSLAIASKFMLMTADFSKEGFLTGANLRDADVILNVTRSEPLDTNYGQVYVLHFVIFDRVARLTSSNSGAQIYF